MLLRWFEQSQVYHPSRNMESTGAELKRPFEDVFFKTEDGIELNGWFYPAGGAAGRTKVFLICHGNGGNISHRLDLYRALLETGHAVFAFDFRGYGRSGGKPGEEGTYLDAQAAARWLREKKISGKDMIAYGESLGGAIAAELCLRDEIGALILQSTFTSIVDIGAELFPWLPVRRIATIRYDTLSKLPRLTLPLLVMHSREDDLIAFHHAEKLFAAANEPKWFREIQGDHNSPLTERAGFIEAIEQFLRRPAASE